ncbi:MAG: twin-arginine translocase TatA/TatE family subunit [Methylobacter sp.]|jgi:sec-independent protein translocase protein TatA|uniref:twin-arginine translocase TatA/TatE family subunit n=1 Tax=unclassified Methylobacter TaxID=2635283 RepID=UPI000566B8B3|nr:MULTISPECIES: twin-arginine translocase TatA/TatE family subunit [unclassified Methylobacter]MCL7420722.1 twin-arginine translocase TatA/TatE family subunit [Methylobacter sp.]
MGISVTQLLIVLVIVIIVFGTKRLRNLGSDLGGAIKSFRSAVKEGEDEKNTADEDGKTIDGEVIDKKNEKV